MELGIFKEAGPHQWYIRTSLTDKAMEEIKEIVESLDQSENNESNHALIGKIEKEYWVSTPNSVKDHIFKCIQHFSDDIKRVGIGSKKKIIDLSYLKYVTNSKTRDSAAWINFQKKYEYNPMHNHTGDFSYAIWYKIPYTAENEAKLGPGSKANKMTNGHFAFYYAIQGEPTFELLQNDKSKEGTLLIFPADLRHGVFPFYTSDEYRISLSGNIVQDLNNPERKKPLL